MLSQSFRLPFFIEKLEPMRNSICHVFMVEEEEGVRYIRVFMGGIGGDSPEPVVVFEKIEYSVESGTVSLHEDLDTALQHINKEYIGFEGYPGHAFFEYCLSRGLMHIEEAEGLAELLKKEKAK